MTAQQTEYPEGFFLFLHAVQLDAGVIRFTLNQQEKNNHSTTTDAQTASKHPASK